MRIKLAALLVSMVSMIAVSAFADGKTAPATTDKGKGKTAEQMVTNDCALATKANKKCVINIEAESIGANHVGPGGSGVGVLTFGNAGSLIRLRQDFIPEIVKTAEDL
jgi:hypothetical protein